MARRTSLIVLVAALGALAVGAFATIGAAGPAKAKGKRMSSYLEVPAVSSPNAKGRIDVRVRSSTLVEYELSYSGLSGPAAAAHIHFAQAGVTGGVAAWLCGGGGKPACPGASGTVGGTIAPGDLNPIGQTTAQGLLVNEMDEFIAALRAGVMYANVHTAAFPGGELRGQIKSTGGKGKKDDDEDDD